MSFSYRNPILGDTQTSPKTPTSDDRTYGLNFSVYNIGGYMEVDTLSDLGYTTNSATGNINYSGNTIPVNFYVSSTPLASKVFLWPDKISSGRRRLGMLVYVRDNDTTYQYRIPNYNTLYNNADSEGVVVYDGQTYYEVRNKSGLTSNSAGQALLDAWTGSTIEGQSGVTRENANWIKYHASAPEYISINAVPAGSNILTWLSGNSINDAFITIPSKWEGRQLISVNATYGNSNSQTNATFKLEMRDSTNSVDSSVSWTHTANNRLKSETFGSPLTLKSGHTLNIGITSNPDTNAEGYSASFEIDG
jgi:hypothetical protein